MADKSFVNTPVEMIANPPAGNRGGPGSYDKIPGYPGRTHSPNAVPEKFLEETPPSIEKATNVPAQASSGPKE